MEIRYSLGENDLLNFQMYSAGESGSVRRRFKMTRFVVPVLFSAIGAWFWLTGGRAPAFAAWLVALVFMIWAPAIIRRQHIKHYRNHIREKCQGMLDTEATLCLESDGLRSQGEGSDGRIQFSAIESLAEVETLGLIKLKQGVTLLVPKASAGSDYAAFMAALSERSGLAIEDHRAKRWAEPV